MVCNLLYGNVCKATSYKNINLLFSVMKFKLLLLFLILGTTQMKSQNKQGALIGIGLFRVSLNTPIPLYHSIHDNNAYDTINFAIVQDGEYKGKYEFRTKNAQLIPYTFYSGSSNAETESLKRFGLSYMAPVLSFKVSTKYKNAVEVYINEETAEKSVIKFDNQHQLYLKGEPYWGTNNRKTSWYLYETWHNYLKRLMSIQTDDTTTIAYDRPNGKIIRGFKTLSDYNKVKEVKGDWIRVGQFDDEQKSTKKIWIKWNNGYKPTIKFIEEICL